MGKWEKVKISEISDQVRGVSYSPSDSSETPQENYVPILRAHNIQEEGLNENDLVYVDKKKVSDKQYIKSGDVLICASSGSKNLVGKAAQALYDMECSFGAFCKVVRPRDSIFKRYLGFYFQCKQYRKTISSLSAGANINNLRNEHIGELIIPYPPFEEQRKIAATLDAVADLLKMRKQQLAELDKLVKSQFIEMFGDPVTNPMGWDVKTFPFFAKIDANMTTEFDKYADYPHIGIDSIEKDTGEIKDYRTVRQDDVKSGKYIFTPNHIIYSKIRPNLNKVALPTFFGLCSADAYPILANEENCSKIFLAFMMRSDLFLSYVMAFSQRTNMPKVNREQIMGFSMPLPPLPLQNRFADFVQKVDQAKGTVQHSIDQTQALFDSLMSEYFD